MTLRRGSTKAAKDAMLNNKVAAPNIALIPCLTRNAMTTPSMTAPASEITAHTQNAQPGFLRSVIRYPRLRLRARNRVTTRPAKAPIEPNADGIATTMIPNF
jgi:hypothetical protein